MKTVVIILAAIFMLAYFPFIAVGLAVGYLISHRKDWR